MDTKPAAPVPTKSAPAPAPKAAAPKPTPTPKKESLPEVPLGEGSEVNYFTEKK